MHDEKPWGVRFASPGQFENLFRLLAVFCEHVRPGAGYAHEGIGRIREKRHCLFKYTLSGRGEFRLGKKWFSVPAGHAFLTVIPSDHYYGFPADGVDEWRFLYICFAGRPAFTLVDEIVTACGPVFSLPRKSPPITLLESFRGQSGGGMQFVDELFGSRLVHDFLMSFLRTVGAGASPGDSDDRISRAVEFINGGSPRDVNANAVARHLDVSREHFSRVFTKRMGVAPARYIRRERVLRAAMLLKDSSFSVKEIARETGFESSAHFCRVFKRETGWTPLEFRSGGTFLPI